MDWDRPIATLSPRRREPARRHAVAVSTFAAVAIVLGLAGPAPAQSQGDNWLTRLLQPSASAPVPPQATAGVPGAGPREWSGQSGASGDPRMSGRRHSRRCRQFRQLPRGAVAAGSAARRVARELRALHRRADARSAHHGSARCAAGIHQDAVGVSRRAGQRRAHRPRPRAVGAERARVRRRRARLRRRPSHHRGDLGRRIRTTAPWAASVRSYVRQRRSPASAAAAIFSARSFSPRSKSWRAATSRPTG